MNATTKLKQSELQRKMALAEKMMQPLMGGPNEDKALLGMLIVSGVAGMMAHGVAKKSELDDAYLEASRISGIPEDALRSYGEAIQALMGIAAAPNLK